MPEFKLPEFKMPELDIRQYMANIIEAVMATDVRILAGSGIAALIVIFFLCQKLLKKRKKRLRDEVLFGLYISLMEAYGYYYWVILGSIAADDPVILEKTRTLENMIHNQSDQLKSMRVYRDIDHILSEEHLLPRDMYKAYGDALERLGGFISNYCPKISVRIEEMGFEPDKIVNAPGFLDWAPKRKKQWKKR